MDTVNIRNLRVGDVLKELGYVTEDQIVAALAYQKEHKGVRIGNALIQLGFIEEKQLLEALADRINTRVIDLGRENVDLKAVEMIPQPLAQKYEMLAIRIEEGRLVLAINDPMNFYAMEDIRQLTGMELVYFLAEKEELERYIHYYYSEISARQAANIANSSTIGEDELEDITDITAEGDDDTPIINLLNRLISRAFTSNASDIHIEPFEKETVVRMRIDGAIVEYVKLQKNLHASLIARIKILGEMDIAERRIPQDGHFRAKLDNEYINIRVSVLPTVFGEKAVMRLLVSNAKVDYPTTFGMDDMTYQKVRRMIESPNGIIYFTGPTGSGKTTTLYMILEYLSRQPVNIATIEDPVEKNLPKINQTQVNAQAGLTFEAGLRSLLRQDPDIIMVGETRDGETANISVRSAITGHLVFSTLHTNDAISSIIRLEDMGLAPYMVSSALVGIIAQRLMRKVCPDCVQEVEPTEEEIRLIGPGIPKIKKAKGCAACNFTGYRGRIAIHETLLIDQEIKKMIMNSATEEEINEYACKHQHMKTLRQGGIEMVAKGVTTVEELKKVTFSI